MDFETFIICFSLSLVFLASSSFPTTSRFLLGLTAMWFYSTMGGAAYFSEILSPIGSAIVDLILWLYDATPKQVSPVQKGINPQPEYDFVNTSTMAVHFQLFDTAAAYTIMPTTKVLAAHFVNICLMTILLAALSFGILLVLSALTLELSLLGITLSPMPVWR
ncbi:hypothetical protein B0J15DRAFT_543401 [Fusarium solani]|uniref:Uncharacterized protein n=1 Tax=Fusarium solani TaxID=169388 RepID=A0A9P9L232_FUSSL|nr:uncharacterized protein B0J15DRAFT_543401 [Fusarium solani]KAH7272804.1 hypothetical protein B0J15DRAFT_543401 [Fusarium solani]